MNAAEAPSTTIAQSTAGSEQLSALSVLEDIQQAIDFVELLQVCLDGCRPRVVVLFLVVSSLGFCAKQSFVALAYGQSQCFVESGRLHRQHAAYPAQIE